MILSPLPLRAKRAASLLQVYQNAARSAELRAQEVASVTDQMLTLFAERGVEQSVLAAAVTEQAARTKLHGATSPLPEREAPRASREPLMNIPDAPAALAPLLRRLFYEADTGISQHAHAPQPNVWYAGHGTYGDFGPYASAEDAVVGLVANLWERLDEVRRERDLLERMRDSLRAELRAAHDELQRVGGELMRRGGGGDGTPPTASIS